MDCNVWKTFLFTKIILTFVYQPIMNLYITS